MGKGEENSIGPTTVTKEEEDLRDEMLYIAKKEEEREAVESFSWANLMDGRCCCCCREPKERETRSSASHTQSLELSFFVRRCIRVDGLYRRSCG